MNITIPDFGLVVLIGTSGSGKSTFARRHFKPTEIVSSDTARGLVDDNENSQEATDDAFAVVHFLVATRLKRRKLVVVDATNVRAEDRKHLVALARQYHALSIAIVLNPGEDICHERNKLRPDRQFGPHVVKNQTRSMKQGLRGLDREGFRYSWELRSVAEIDAVTIERQPAWTDKRSELGPFDIIGDVHGCCDELEALLATLGYQVSWTGSGQERSVMVTAPPGRRAIFVGDLVDRGPRSPDVLRIVMALCTTGQGFCVPGNHDAKFLKWLQGRQVTLTHGLAETVAQMEAEPAAFKGEVRTFVDGLISHLWLDGGALAVAHAGLKQEMIGRASGAIREFCLYGDTTGETDAFGLPVRLDWAQDYRGDTAIIYGHTPVAEADWLNNTLCIDTGCCFGRKLTALQWPERTLVSVPARKTYAESKRPLTGAAGERQQSADLVLDLADVLGKLHIKTRLGRTVLVDEANSAAALEVMSRFAVDPRWLLYLPPTMSPSETTMREGLLEHPDEAFSYFRREGVTEVVCEEKHMGSRAVLVVCRDAGVADQRFGVDSGETGMIMTRTGRMFFQDRATTEGLLARVRAGLDAAGFWAEHNTGWVVLDAEIMPWSAKAQGLIRDQFAATGAAARMGLSGAVAQLTAAAQRGIDLGGMDAGFQERELRARRYVAAYRRYCWPVKGLDDYRIAPFHVLASEGASHMDRDHLWHMRSCATICAAGDPVLMATPFHVVSLADDAQVAAATAWWEHRTAEGGEGMVVKPRDYLVRGERGIVQPAIKCRGSEYLRIIYGPEYDVPANLERLRKRGLGHKRSLAIREFVLGYEALARFVERAPLRRVHECVFAVLALESEPVDPRL
jgi:protein phosphatase